jgi:3-phosphoshikimate 1-carboxyvinyltransferase
MTRLLVHPVAAGLTGSVPVPSDKSVSHRALIFAALSRGTCCLRGFSYGEDNVSTLEAFRSMGVQIDDAGDGTVQVAGVGLGGLRAPTKAIDCGNSILRWWEMHLCLAAQWDGSCIHCAPVGR